MNYRDTLSYLAGLTPLGIRPGLERIGKILAFLKDPQKRVKHVLIGGTNGKGSVSAMLSSILNQAGLKVGLYTSPHFQEYLERFRFNEKEITKKEFAYNVTRIKEAIHKTGIQLTLFEVLTVAAFCYFEAKKVDLAILEVGLGGRLDATNVSHPLVSVITNVSFDHQDILGETLSKIAFEKAGIIKSGVPLVTAAQGEILKLFKEIAKGKKSPCYPVSKKRLKIEREGHQGQWVKGTFFRPLFLPLLGEYQILNLMVVLKVLNLLSDKYHFKISQESLALGLQYLKLRGRFEIVKKDPLIILDGAHNPAGIKSFKRSLKRIFPFRRVLLVVGILETKDASTILKELSSITDTIILTASQHPRALLPARLREMAEPYYKNIKVRKSVEEALNLALSLATCDSLIAVTGSLFTVGESFDCLKKIR